MKAHMIAATLMAAFGISAESEPVASFSPPKLLPPAPPEALTKRQKRRVRGRTKGGSDVACSN